MRRPFSPSLSFFDTVQGLRTLLCFPRGGPSSISSSIEYPISCTCSFGPPAGACFYSPTVLTFCPCFLGNLRRGPTHGESGRWFISALSRSVCVVFIQSTNPARVLESSTGQQDSGMGSPRTSVCPLATACCSSLAPHVQPIAC